MTLIDITSARTFAIDLGERALGTLWQAGIGAATPIILTASTGDLSHVAWWKQLLLAVLGAAVASLLALVKGVVAGAKTGTASLSTQVAQTSVSPGAHATDTATDGLPADSVDAQSLLAGLPPVTDADTQSILAADPTAHSDTTGVTS